MNILVTGAAGFIGMHTTERLLQQGHHVLGLDSFSPYYDVQLKRDRAALLGAHPHFQLLEADINNTDVLANIEKIMKPQRVVYLAAQVGVRHSILQPMHYASANLTGYVGNANPVQLDVFIQAIEQALGKSAIRINREIQGGDVEVTAADTCSLQTWTGQSPSTDLHVGVKRFVDWYVQRYGVKKGEHKPW